MDRRVALRDQLTAGIAAGIAGAAVMAAFLYANTLHGVPTQAVLGVPAWTAGGIALQFFVGIAWGCGYASLARSQPQLLRRPLISGLVFGIIVYAAMQVLAIMDGGYHRPSAATTIGGLAGYVVCYGLPVGAITARILHRA